MKKRKFLLLLSSITFLLVSATFAQDLPVKEWAGTHDKPAIFYITGDGGLNTFSNNLCKSLNDSGYDVFAWNAKSYFWKQKTPEQTATDIDNYLVKKIAGRANQHIIFVGYSFGADVLPFVVNRLSKDINQNVIASFIMASSGSTDFEIHWSDIFGGNKQRSMDVVTEINKLVGKTIIIITGSDEETLALNKITLKKYTHEILPGGHHFEGNTEEITRVLLKHIE
ncbi:MAG: AcvB/VirJ family lysyl-phosphatidylglycerol hydrolase [Ginsengibacter sp.]